MKRVKKREDCFFSDDDCDKQLECPQRFSILETTDTQNTELFHRRSLGSKCSLTLATLATTALTSGVEALSNSAEHHGSSTSSSDPSRHHLMHQHHHGHHVPFNSASKTQNEMTDFTHSGSSLSNTVRRISLNILNSSSSALESLRSTIGSDDATGGHHPFRSASAAGSYHTCHHEHGHSSGPSDSAGHTTLPPVPASPTTAGPITSTLTTTYSYLTDIFPRLLPKSSGELKVDSTSDLPSTGYTDAVDYIIDDYDTLDSIGTGSPLLSDSLVSGTTMASPASETTSLASSSDIFMRLMRNVLNNSGEETSSPVSSDLFETAPRSHHFSGSAESGLFASHLLSDPVVASAAASSASSASSSPVSSLLIPSLMSSSTSGTSTTSTAIASAGDGSDTSRSSSSPYHDFFHLFSSHRHPNNGTIPAAFSALTSSQLVASSYGSPVQYQAQLDDSLSHSALGSNISSIISTTTATVSAASSALSGAAASMTGAASSSSYYASELSSSFASTIMDDYTATAATTAADFEGPMDWFDILILVLKIIVLGSIILSAIFGNLLVIISVLRHHRLRITTNYFIVSLALADILVAFFAMTFNASVIFTGHWIFDMWVCDFWNCCDVLFSTASIMHLSCISYDRYYAIIKPLDYPMKVTTKRVYVMIGCVWTSSVLISSIPVFTGIYTTDEAMANRELYPDRCEFIVNIPYALISSTVSFWMPCGIMIAAYFKILKEALKQEKFIYRTQQMANANNYHGHHNVSDAKKNKKNDKNSLSSDTQHLNAPRHSSASENNVIQIQSGGHRNSHAEDPESGSSTPTKRTISKMKREHKAAKTLGIIMGAFIACWFPFFIWYVLSTILNWNTPKVVVDLLFWVGYLNSAMNPIIYAYFNREFREAFKETLRNLVCCCLHLKCLEQQRSDAISFSCTYRSTTDVGLVENKYVKE